MLFSSVIFVCYFLPVFLAAYYATGARNAVLLLGSIIFYAWGEGKFLPLLMGLVLINYYAALLIAGSSKAFGRATLLTTLVFDFGVLCFFKYANFIIEQINAVVGFEIPSLSISLPLGISFFTFQLASYLVDVYRSEVSAERNFIRFATYIMMFPHLIAGPIVRFVDIVDELKYRLCRVSTAGLGIQYFIVGLSQKVLIANTLAPIADSVFSAPDGGVSMASSWLGTAFYTLQIYFDFCGYSNMAIGLAFMLGFHFPRNFNYPYSALSVTEFWRRWHISLSSWFRDYVYIPLGGSRRGQAITLRNLLIVFSLTGLWHGAAWTFIAWGMFHGLFLVLERSGFKTVLARAPSVVAHAYTIIVVMIGWVFFRADDFGHATKVIAAMVGLSNGEPVLPLAALLSPEAIMALAFGCLLSFPVIPRLLDWIGKPRLAPAKPNDLPNAGTLDVHQLPITVLVVGFVLSLALLATNTLNPFLYFRF